MVNGQRYLDGANSFFFEKRSLYRYKRNFSSNPPFFFLNQHKSHSRREGTSQRSSRAREGRKGEQHRNWKMNTSLKQVFTFFHRLFFFPSKQRAKQEQIMEELHYGSVPRTPKRRMNTRELAQIKKYFPPFSFWKKKRINQNIFKNISLPLSQRLKAPLPKRSSPPPRFLPRSLFILQRIKNKCQNQSVHKTYFNFLCCFQTYSTRVSDNKPQVQDFSGMKHVHQHPQTNNNNHNK